MTNQRNTFAINSESIFLPLPAKGLASEGWLRRQIMEDARNGWIARVNKMSQSGIMAWDANGQFVVPYYPPGCLFGEWKKSVPFYQPLIDRLGVFGNGEFQAHWLDSILRMGYVAGIREFRELGKKCVEDILKNRDSSGYLGVDQPEVRFTGTYIAPFGEPNGMFELSAMGTVLNSLLLYFRFAGDKRVLKACLKAADLICERTAHTSLPMNGGPLITNALTDLYRLTGERKYLAKAMAVLLDSFKFICNYDNDPFNKHKFGLKGAHSAFTGTIELALVNLYRATGDAGLLQRAIDINDQVVAYALQPHGAPTGHSESLQAAGADINTELCDTVWWSWFWIEMLELTGEPKYADLAEKAILNALPGSRSKDGSVTAYFMRPNQLFAVRQKGRKISDANPLHNQITVWHTLYASRLFIECCQANAPRLMPILAEHMIMKKATGGFAIPFYGPCRAKCTTKTAGEITIRQQTSYPFDERIIITVHIGKGSAEFPLWLRIPGWCRQADIRINGQAAEVAAEPCSWACLKRTWKDGDKVALKLPMEIRVNSGKDSVSVERGPLLYALPVKGARTQVDQWGSFEERINAGSRWNYALYLDKKCPVSSFKLKKLKVADHAHVWEQPPYGLEAPAVSLPGWLLDRMDAGPEALPSIPEPDIPKPPLRCKLPPIKIVLVPFGFTTLRMTCLPVFYHTERHRAGASPT